MKNFDVIAIVGPTASGKTKLGVSLAKALNGEIISADSMQIYKDISISTAKPTLEEMDGIKHYLIDFLPLNQVYSVAEYCNDANKIIAEIRANKKLPIIVGGTGLYVDSLINGIVFDDQEVDFEYREELDKYTNDELFEKLSAIDSEYANKIHKNNRKRLIRALELYKTSNKTMTEQEKLSHVNGKPFNTLLIGLDFEDREKLYSNIHKRVDKMLEEGLLEEAKKYTELGKTSAQSIGIKELIPYFKGELSLEESVENIKKQTRHFAKRQLSWFRRNKDINWFYIDKYCNFNDLILDVLSFVNE